MTERVVLVTGAAGGIGSAITRALIAAGHSVAAVDRDATALGRLPISERIQPIMADLANEAACREAVASAVARFGRLEAVINNAGVGVSSLRGDAEKNVPGIEELTAEIWDRFYTVNVRGHVLVTQAALPHLRAAKFGRIVNNTTSFRSMLRVNPYGPLKAALEALSVVWAEELKKDALKQAQLRSSLLELLTQQLAEHLNSPEGKAELKKAIAARASESLKPLKVTDVLFSDFVVQF